MPLRLVRAAVSAALLLLLLSACEMTVRIGAHVAADGSGTLKLAIDLDRELYEGLMQAEGDGLRAVEGLFERLDSAGWATARRERDGGLALSAERSFADETAFAAGLREVAGAESPPGTTAPLRLDIDTTGSFFRTRGRFAGEIDTTGFAQLPGIRDRRALETFRDEIARVVRFEIEASMPGSISITDGGGTVSDGAAVWRPQFGSHLRFAASSSALDIGAIALVVVPAFAILGLLIWALARRHGVTAAPEPAPIGASLPANGRALNGASSRELLRLSDLPTLPAPTEEPVVSLEPIDLTETPVRPGDPL